MEVDAWNTWLSNLVNSLFIKPKYNDWYKCIVGKFRSKFCHNLIFNFIRWIQESEKSSKEPCRHVEKDSKASKKPMSIKWEPSSKTVSVKTQAIPTDSLTALLRNRRKLMTCSIPYSTKSCFTRRVPKIASLNKTKAWRNARKKSSKESEKSLKTPRKVLINCERSWSLCSHLLLTYNKKTESQRLEKFSHSILPHPERTFVLNDFSILENIWSLLLFFFWLLFLTVLWIPNINDAMR